MAILSKYLGFAGGEVGKWGSGEVGKWGCGDVGKLN